MRDCLGYALTAEETSAPVQAQSFHNFYRATVMVAVSTPEGRFIYVTYHTYHGGSACISVPHACLPDYARYADPAR